MAQETKRVLPMSTYDITKMYKEAKDKRKSGTPSENGHAAGE